MTTIVPGDVKSQSIISSLFSVEFKKLATGEFTEISGMNIDIEEVSSTQITADGKTVTMFSPGTVKYGTLTLKREFTGNKEFWTWHDEMCKGKDLHADGSIVLYNLARKEVDRWTVYRAWPSKWSVSDLDAGSDDVMVEEIELQIEFIEREA